MRKSRSAPAPILVENTSQVDELCARCLSDGRFAFDTEFVMEDRFASQVCLIQIATADRIAIIDPFLDLDLAPVWGLVGDENVETVVHAGQEDLALSVQQTGRGPRRVFDVQIAAGLTGDDYPLSLQRVVQQFLHIRLHKSKTLTDWRRRPLSEAQLKYAAEDVAYLLEVQRILNKKLAALSRQSWAHEEFQRMEDLTLYTQADEDKLLRLKGCGRLDGRQLAIARDLLSWRTALAQRLNRPARVVLKDHLLVEIAKHELGSLQEVRVLRGLNLSNRDVRSLTEVVAHARNTPEHEWPTPKPHVVESPRDSALTALATAVIRSYCLENNLAYGLAASQRSIRQLLAHTTFGRGGSDDHIELLEGWRRETIGALLEDVLSGRRAVHVENLNGERTIRVDGISQSGAD